MIYLLALFLFTSSALAMNCQHDADTFRCVKFIDNYDGDTIKVTIKNIHPIFGKKLSIRIKGIDTPEIKSKNKCEKELAKKAKEVVHNILYKAKNIELRNISRGKYFRIVADVYADKINISKTLLKKSLAYKYSGKTKKKINWCLKR